MLLTRNQQNRLIRRTHKVCCTVDNLERIAGAVAASVRIYAAAVVDRCTIVAIARHRISTARYRIELLHEEVVNGSVCGRVPRVRGVDHDTVESLSIATSLRAFENLVVKHLDEAGTHLHANSRNSIRRQLLLRITASVAIVAMAVADVEAACARMKPDARNAISVCGQATPITQSQVPKQKRATCCLQNMSSQMLTHNHNSCCRRR